MDNKIVHNLIEMCSFMKVRIHTHTYRGMFAVRIAKVHHVTTISTIVDI